MRKILWFSNRALSNANNKGSGTWLYSMAELLFTVPNIQLINVTVNPGFDKEIKHIVVSKQFEEYLIPQCGLDKLGLPNKNQRTLIKDLCQSITPDIIHVWGVENYFSKLLPLLGLRIPLLLEIQGLISTCAEVFYGDLSIKELFQCIGLREILFPSSKNMFALKKKMTMLGSNEITTIQNYRYISTQSCWIRDRIRFMTSSATIFETGMSIRNDFFDSKKWTYPIGREKNFYCSAAGAVSYKSIQTAIRALKLVVSAYFDAKLYIIGNFARSNWIHQSGYLTFIYKLISNLGLKNNVIFTGPLNSLQIIDIMHKSIGMVQTSYVESYSLALVEAQLVGVPSIVSYAGAMPELAKNRESALFFTPGDYTSCAAKMIELIENPQLAERLSKRSLEISTDRNANKKVLETQLSIYQTILNNNND